MRRIGTGLIALSMALTGVITGHVGIAYAANTWWISPPPPAGIGDDHNDCSQKSPCATLQHISQDQLNSQGARVQPGDTVQMLPGINDASYGPQVWSGSGGKGDGTVTCTAPPSPTCSVTQAITIIAQPGAIIERTPAIGVLPDQNIDLLSINSAQGLEFDNLVIYGSKGQVGYQNQDDEHCQDSADNSTCDKEWPNDSEIHLFTTSRSSGVATIPVDGGGSGYTSVPTVTITGHNDGMGATATATVVNQQVTSITVNNHGSGYIIPPAVQIDAPMGPGGTTAAAYATLGYDASGCLDPVPYSGDSACGWLVTLKNPTVKYANNSCITSEYALLTIDGANLHDCGNSGDGLDHGIYLTQWGNTVTNSNISGSTGYGVTFHSSGCDTCGKGDGLTITDNTLYANRYGGIVSTDANPMTVTGNLIHDNGLGIQESGTGSGLVVTHNVFSDNTDYQNSDEAIIYEGPAGPNGTRITNNTFFQNAAHHGGGPEIDAVAAPTGSNNVIECNIFSGITSFFGNGQLTSSISSNFFGTNPNPLTPKVDYNLYWNISHPSYANEKNSKDKTDPRFVQEPLNFHLEQTSQAVNACGVPGLNSYIGALGSS